MRNLIAKLGGVHLSISTVDSDLKITMSRAKEDVISYNDCFLWNLGPIRSGQTSLGVGAAFLSILLMELKKHSNFKLAFFDFWGIDFQK